MVSLDNIDHEWMVQFVEQRIADRRLVGRMQKWLKAGVSEEGQWLETTVGTPQGAVASPRLAHIYLQYVFDTWVNQWRKKSAQGTGLGSATPTTSSWGSNPGQRRRGEGNLRPFTFWDSRTVAGRRGKAAGSRGSGGRSPSG